MESFGAKLRREREKKGITLDDISLSTKIGTRLLRALEDEHFDQLPGGIFNKGFVRAYARHLGLDEDQTVSDYLAASGDVPPAKTLEPQIADALEARAEEAPSGVAQIPWGYLAIALLLIALGFAVWGFNSREKERETREVTVAPAVPPKQTPEAATPAATQTQAAPAESQPANQTAPPTPAPVSAAPAAGEFVVVMKAHDESWVSIKTDTEPATEATLEAGMEKSIHAKDTIAIRAGNVGAVDFYWNGKQLPPQGETGEAKTLTFGPQGLQPPKPATPTTTQPQ